MKEYRQIIIALLLILTFIVTGCNKDELMTVYREAEVSVYTTIYPIQFIVEEIGDEIIEVESIYPPGVDAHTFEPTTKEMTEIAEADAFIYFGPTLEGFASSAAEALEKEEVRLIALEEYDEIFEKPKVTEDDSDEAVETADKFERNPHVRLDPLRMIMMAEIITEQLIDLAPDHEELFEENKKELFVQLQKLEDKFKLELVDKNNKYIIVPHAAYGYWEERYGIEEIALSGLSPSEEPSQKYLAEIIEEAKDLGISTLFYEQNTPDKLIEVLKDELEAETYTLHNLSVLTEEDIEAEQNYVTLMEHNIETLVEAFDN